MKLSRVVHGKPAVLWSLTLAVAAAGGAYNYLPAWAATEQLTKYMSSGLVGLAVGAFLLTLSVLTAPETRDSGTTQNLGARAVALAQKVGEGISAHIFRSNQSTMAIGHYVDQQGHASPLSTAYAVRAILGCPSVIACAPLTRLLGYLVTSREESGWRAASQSQPRPEVSADVARAIRALDGDSDVYLSAIEGLRAQVDADRACTEVTYVAATVLAALPNLQATADLRTRIGDAIANGFVRIDGRLGYWSATLAADRISASGSPAATARCLIALKAHSELCGRDSARAMAQSAMNWLAIRERFPNETEQIVRPLSAGSTEVLVPRHFSAALVVLAACAWRELDSATEVAMRGIRGVVESHADGYWRWDDGKAPVWMNAQGIEAADAYVVAFGDSEARW